MWSFDWFCLCLLCVDIILNIYCFLDPEGESRENALCYWEELPCGVYSIAIDASGADACLAGKVGKHEWVDSMLKDLIKWERKLVEPNHSELNSSNSLLFSASDNGVLSYDFDFEEIVLKIFCEKHMSVKVSIFICCGSM